MPSTVVHAGLAVLLAAALLGADLDERALGVLVVVLAVPELDTAAGLWIDGAHRALLHTLLVPALGGGLLYYDTHLRTDSWVAGRWGPRGVRLAWTALAVHVCAHVLLDYAHLEGVNLLYPMYDRFFRLDGELALSTAEGFVQTFVEVATEGGEGSVVDVGATGTTETTHVANPVEPDAETGVGDETAQPVDRRLPVAVWGWQLYLIGTAAFVLVARRFQRADPPERG